MAMRLTRPAITRATRVPAELGIRRDLSDSGRPGAVVPLSRQAMAVFFGPHTPECPSSVAPIHTRSGSPLASWDRETEALLDANGMPRPDLHRSDPTMLGGMGELADIIEAALNRVPIRSRLSRTYNQSRYRPQVAVALQRLAEALDEIAP